MDASTTVPALHQISANVRKAGKVLIALHRFVHKNAFITEIALCLTFVHAKEDGKEATVPSRFAHKIAIMGERVLHQTHAGVINGNIHGWMEEKPEAFQYFKLQLVNHN